MDVLDDLTKLIYIAIGSEQLDECIQLCKKAMMLTRESDFDKWWDVRFIYSKCLIAGCDDNICYITEAIDYLEKLVDKISRDTNPLKWAMANLALGFAYDERKDGERKSNIEMVLKYYGNALEVFTQNEYPEEWAASLAGRGYAYAMREIGNIQENILKAMECILLVLQYYTRSDHPCQYWDKLKELNRLRLKLQDESLWNDLGSQFDNWNEINRDLRGEGLRVGME